MASSPGSRATRELGTALLEVGAGMATWAIRRGWSMTHWRESASLMWRNLEHVTGAYSEHAKTKKYTQRRGAWGGAHRAAGTHRANVVTRRCVGQRGVGAGAGVRAAPEPVSVRSYTGLAVLAGCFYSSRVCMRPCMCVAIAKLRLLIPNLIYSKQCDRRVSRSLYNAGGTCPRHSNQHGNATVRRGEGAGQAGDCGLCGYNEQCSTTVRWLSAPR